MPDAPQDEAVIPAADAAADTAKPAEPTAAEVRDESHGEAPVDREPPTAKVKPSRTAPRASTVAVAIYLVCTVIFAVFAGDRLRGHSPDNHFAYLAQSYLHGTLSLQCPPDEAAHNTCPPGGGGNDWARYHDKWFVAFPSFPAVVYMPAVAIFGRDFRNVLYDTLLAGIAPALLYVLLERLARRGRSDRTWKENVGFATLFAFGTVYFYSSVQGSVWFTAHMMCCALTVGYLFFALDAERPFFAGVLLAMAIHTRADMSYAAPFFAIEVLRVFRRKDALPAPVGANALTRLRAWLAGVDWRGAMVALVKFGAPVAAAVLIALYLNKARFGDPGEVGYRYLQIRWRDRIDRWGLFNYHYLSRNLAIVLASLPWFTRQFPFVMISLHGVALWVTTPHFLELPRIHRRPGDPYTPFLAATAATIALVELLYQNSGWVQFGYRFSNDYSIFLILLLAINGRRIGRVWTAAWAAALLINGFGAATFGREVQIGSRRVSFYDNDNSQQRYFQPD